MSKHKGCHTFNRETAQYLLDNKISNVKKHLEDIRTLLIEEGGYSDEEVAKMTTNSLIHAFHEYHLYKLVQDEKNAVEKEPEAPKEDPPKESVSPEKSESSGRDIY